MKRGDVWVKSRLGHEYKVVVVGNDGLTATRPYVLVVPISDVTDPGLVQPVVADGDGSALGVAQIPRVGEVSKASLIKQSGVLAPASVEMVDIALRAALAL